MKLNSSRRRIIGEYFFQVHTAQRVEYSSGSFYGNETGKATRSLLSFLVTSVGGSYEDLVCFFPTVTLNWSLLMRHFDKIITALSTISLRVVVVIVDGHKTNVHFYSELSGGKPKLCIPNPTFLEKPLYIMYDPVHLFKNFYNNFERHRYA